MEDLVMDDPGLGLNIICQDPIMTTNNNNNDNDNEEKKRNKKKKYNKYEKRRYKAKLAKEGLLNSNRSYQSSLHPMKLATSGKNGKNGNNDSTHSNEMETREQNTKTNDETNKSMKSLNTNKVDEVHPMSHDNDGILQNTNNVKHEEKNENEIDVNRKSSRRYHVSDYN